MIALPFTAPDFFAVFARYNTAVWPAHLVLYGIAAVIVANVIRHERPRLVLVLLAVLWLWMGVVYHMMFFSPINPAAWLFGIAFIAQAMLLGFARARAADPTWPHPLAPIAGKMLVAYAMVGYPLIGYLAGHRYPETPTFGAPCPTTIFTLGVLLWSQGDVRGRILAIPVAWAIIGTSAAMQLSVPQDYGLIAAALATLLRFARRPAPQAAG